jgi:trehalose/maltose transport system substrate-binding protein
MELSNIPTRRSLYQDQEILAKRPFFARIPAILEAATARPSTVTGARYSEVTAAFYTSVHNILTGKKPPKLRWQTSSRPSPRLKGKAGKAGVRIIF